MYGRADDRAGGNIFGGAWGWHLGYEAYLARKARADDMIKHFPCIDNKEDDEIFGYVNESLQALKDKIYDEVLFDSFPYKIYEHDVEQIRTDVNAACDSLINLKTAYAQSSGDIESDSYN